MVLSSHGFLTVGDAPNQLTGCRLRMKAMGSIFASRRGSKQAGLDTAGSLLRWVRDSRAASMVVEFDAFMYKETGSDYDNLST